MKKKEGRKKLWGLLATGLLLCGVIAAVFLSQDGDREERRHRMRRGRVETTDALFAGLVREEEEYDVRKFQLQQESKKEYITIYLSLLEELIEEEKYRGYFSYNLIYVNQDKTPELVVNKYDNGDSTVSIYTCKEEELIEVVEDWPNGEDTANHYLPYQNVVRCQVYENQLLDIYTKYYLMDDEGGLKNQYTLLKKYEWSREEDIRYDWRFYSAYEDDYSSWRYFFKGEKISHREYSSWLIEGEYEGMAGSYTAQEMKELLFSELLLQEEGKIDQSLAD